MKNTISLALVAIYALSTNIAFAFVHRLGFATTNHQNKHILYSSSPTTPTFTINTTSSTHENKTPGRWEELEGNYLLRPPTPDSPPRALIHFLGGAFVGAAPDLSYRYLLERLSAAGYLIVATPYTLSFDYLATCDAILEKFERIAPSLARQYGPVPVVGVGHSCGALLQLLITSLFPDTPRAANALISYNNKEVKDAVPLFEEVVAPLFASLEGGGNETRMGGGGGKSVVQGMELGLEAARYAARGELPPDSLLSALSSYLTTPPFPPPIPSSLPPPLRTSLTSLLQPLTTQPPTSSLTPILTQSIDILSQIPSLIHEVASGARDFLPPPSQVQTAARRAYRARRTLLVKYDNDPLDETDDIAVLLRESETVMRMKRPMVTMDLKSVVLAGGHATPCLAPSLEVAERAEDVMGAERAREGLGYKGVDETVEELVRWMEEGGK